MLFFNRVMFRKLHLKKVSLIITSFGTTRGQGIIRVVVVVIVVASTFF